MNPKDFFESQNLEMHSTYVDKHDEWCCIVFGNGIVCWGFGKTETEAWLDAQKCVKHKLGI